MSLNFPDNPANGEPYTAENGVLYIYNASIDAWTGSSAAGDNYWAELSDDSGIYANIGGVTEATAKIKFSNAGIGTFVGYNLGALDALPE